MTDQPNDLDPLMDCPRCSGSGEGPADGTRCRRCQGTGLILNPAAVSLEDEDDGDAKHDAWNDEERGR